MNKDRKNLKDLSIIILVFAAISLVRIIVDLCVFGLNASNVPVEGVSEDMVRTATIIAFVLALLLLIPDVFIGIRGIKEANNPTGKKGHITWALVLVILSLIATISAVIDMFNGFDVGKLLEVIDVAIDVALFYFYYVAAKKVANA
jgi:hypothetical protein